MAKETQVHAAADQMRSAFRHAARMAFTAGKAAARRHVIRKENAASIADAVAATVKAHLKGTFPGMLRQTFEAGGRAGAAILNHSVLKTLTAGVPFVVVTEDHCGLGWAKKLSEEGERVVIAARPADDEEHLEQFSLVGGGIVPVMTFEDALADPSLKNAIWLFDHNHCMDLAGLLLRNKRTVFPPNIELAENLEHDRQAAVDAANQAGLDTPSTWPFDTNADGLAFLDQNPNTAYVLKPNEGSNNYSTFVPNALDPARANRQVYLYLKYLGEITCGYILQERKDGVEINVELWFDKGEPFFAFCCLENKRRGEKDTGEITGCAGDVAFVIPVDCPLVQQTIGKMIPFYKSHEYTGFADVNVILGDNKVWFLEVCDRWGYSSHPNLLLNLLIDGYGVGQLIKDWLAGTLKGDCAQRFRAGFGASITCYVDHPRVGLPVMFRDEKCLRSWFPFDLYAEGDDRMLAGYSPEAGIVCHHDYTIRQATEGCVKLLEDGGIVCPDMAYRTDLSKTDYPMSPERRYDALKAMRMV